MTAQKDQNLGDLRVPRGSDLGRRRFAASLKRLAGQRPTHPPLDPKPTTAFEIAVAERLKAIDAELEQLRSRLNWLFTVIVGAAIANLVIALLKP